jgi:hypothetical protein
MDRNPTDLPARLQPGQRLLGLDPGEKNVGVAISDPGFTLASPLTTLKRGQLKKLATELAAIVAAEGIGGIVVGLALNMDGSDGPKAQAARQLAFRPPPSPAPSWRPTPAGRSEPRSSIAWPPPTSCRAPSTASRRAAAPNLVARGVRQYKVGF